MAAKASNPALKILTKHKGIVWPEIKKYLKNPTFPLAFRIPTKYEKDIQTHWHIVNEYPKRKGKYLRPTLLLLTTRTMGHSIKKAVKTAAAMQLSEEWLLVHDDFQDHSEVRRKKPTLHKMYGPELAVNAGDTLQVIMWKILADNEKVLSKEKTFAIINEFYKTLMRTTNGQAIEMMWAQGKTTSFSDNDWFFLADGKTSYYTIAAPMRLGAIIAGASNKKLNSLAKFGSCLGRCFQLVDDMLDITSSYKGKGQKIGSDVYEGKRTIMLSHLVRNSKTNDRKRLLAILEKKPESKTQKEVDWVIQKMHDYKSIEYGRKLAERLKEDAFNIFEKELKFLSQEKARNELETLIHFVLERKH